MITNLTKLAPMSITLVAGFILTKSYLELKVENIAQDAQNTLALIKNLSYQKADAVIGSILLFIAYIWQMINLSLPTPIGDCDIIFM